MCEEQDCSQARQWKLLENWFETVNPRKDFTAFLRIYNFPSTITDNDGLYYAQISRKLWYANRQNNPLEWILMKQAESLKYNESDAIISQDFTHEAHAKKLIRDLEIKNQQCEYIIYSQHRTLLLSGCMLYITMLGFLLFLSFQYHYTLTSRDTSQEWWLK